MKILPASYLTGIGIIILERNFRAERGEIDIIAKDNTTLAFVEVKSCKSKAFGEPETWVTLQKQKQIGKVAQAYLQKHHINDMDCRFDVVAVTFDRQKSTVRYIKDAFWLQE